MLQDQIPERDELHLWKLFRSARSADKWVSIREYKCLMHHRTDCKAGVRIVSGSGFKQLERCDSHGLDCHIRKAISADDSDDEDGDSNYPDLVDDSE
jgi:hypothetical protein